MFAVVVGDRTHPTDLSTKSKLWFQFVSLDKKPVFGSIDARRALMQQFNSIQGVNFTEDDLTKFRGIRLTTIVNDPEGQSKIMDALTWMEQQIERPV